MIEEERWNKKTFRKQFITDIVVSSHRIDGFDLIVEDDGIYGIALFKRIIVVFTDQDAFIIDMGIIASLTGAGSAMVNYFFLWSNFFICKIEITLFAGFIKGWKQADIGNNQK